MKRLTYISLMVLLMAGMGGCEQIIEVDFPKHDPKLTLNSFLTPDSSFFVYLTSSIGILDDGDVQEIDNGALRIYQDGVLFDSLVNIGSGAYLSPTDLRPQSGSTYRIEASAPGFPLISAGTTIPAAVQVSSANLDTSQLGTIGTGEIDVRFQDPGNREDYYFLLVYSYTPNSGFYFPGITNSDPTLNAEPMNAYQFNTGILFTDQSFNGNEASISLSVFSDDIVWNRPNLYVLLGSCSEEYFRYTLSYSRYLLSGFNPFAEPVLFPTNVENGLGVFAGFNTHRFQVF